MTEAILTALGALGSIASIVSLVLYLHDKKVSRLPQTDDSRFEN